MSHDVQSTFRTLMHTAGLLSEHRLIDVRLWKQWSIIKVNNRRSQTTADKRHQITIKAARHWSTTPHLILYRH